MMNVSFWIVLVSGLFTIRLTTLGMSSYGWYHGFNEAIYTQISWSLPLDGWDVPRLHGAPFFDTGPLTTYLIAGSHLVFGVSEASSRLPALLAYPVAIWAAHRAAEGFYGPGKGRIAALLVATAPFVLLWFGRAQTDAWMTAGVLLFLAGYANPAGRAGAACIVGGLVVGILAKQPALLLVPFALLLALPKKGEAGSIWQRGRTGFLVLAGTWLGCLWYGVQYLRFPAEYSASTKFHASERVAVLGENASWVLAALVLGSGALLFFSFLARKLDHPFKDKRTILVFGVGGYGLFALFNSPIGHEYYALPAIAILGIWASNWKWTNVTLAACVTLSLVLSVGILLWAGDLGDRQTQEMGIFIDNLPDQAQVAAPDRLVPQLELYSGHKILKNNQVNESWDSWNVAWEESQVQRPEACTKITETSTYWLRPSLKLYRCWGVTWT